MLVLESQRTVTLLGRSSQVLLGAVLSQFWINGFPNAILYCVSILAGEPVFSSSIREVRIFLKLQTFSLKPSNIYFDNPILTQ